ncbi:shikimate kinase [Novosphingobium piscinae]|uniref:Shikimate kinase n=1 Tax=Novosphingobium piscinae TaxID=1507448 RepID=A0A7X1KQZ7_9SPHN|nr:shikimate kinase [Novosphingobium piscinae]MBC2670140.1 shikimate kinase [Novosphingobium piscinae]
MEVDEPRMTSEQIADLARRVRQPIALVGMMGVGKSSVGRKLAHALRLPFVDADEAIEQAAKMTIAEIFATYGEAYFRDGERRVIARLIEQDHDGRPYVIATGGGAFVNPETRRLILDRAIAVWLDSDVDTLVERVGRKDTRPLLRGGDPREILARLHAERAPCYAEAPIKVTSHNGPHSRTLDQVLKGIAAWL